MSDGTRAVRRARVGLALLALALAGWLLLAAKPWLIAGGPAFFPGGRRALADTVAIASWWAAALNAALALALLATASWWALPLPAPPAAPARARLGRGALALLALAALLAGGLRWPLAHSSVWPDEAWTLRDAVSGIARPARDDPRRLVVQTPSWNDTLFGFERPTNHVAFSAAARVSLGAWRALGPDRAPPAFDELWFRLPALLAAVLAAPLLGLLVASWGFPRAGVAAAFWLAIHPWHIHHGAEGRGYSFVVLLAILACLALQRALATGAWRAWLGFGACAVALVWSHLFALWLVLALGAAALAGIAAGPPPLARAARLAVAGVLAAMLLGQLLAPNLAQVPGWRERFVGHSESPLTPAALGHLWAYLATGIEASPYGDPPERPAGVYPSLSEWSQRRLWVYPVVLGVLPALVAVGALRVLARGGAPRFAVAGLLGAIPLGLAGNLVAGGDWAPRFAIFGLVPVVGLGAIGLESALERLPWRGERARRAGVACGLALGLAAYQAFVWPKTTLLLHYGHMPTRDAMRFLDETVGADPHAAIRGVLGLRGGNMHFELYHPWVRDVATAADLAALAAEARARRVPLFVSYGYPHRNRKTRPEPFVWLDDPGYFREIAFFDATQAENVVRVLVFTGRPLPPHLARDGA